MTEGRIGFGDLITRGQQDVTMLRLMAFPCFAAAELPSKKYNRFKKLEEFEGNECALGNACLTLVLRQLSRVAWRNLRLQSS